jgi:hypothetical protein
MGDLAGVVALASGAGAAVEDKGRSCHSGVFPSSTVTLSVATAMNRSDLAAELERLGVRLDSYSLSGDANEAYILDRTSFGWLVYYSERGIRREESRFLTESAACSFLLKRILQDTSART